MNVCLDVVREPEEEHVADELCAEQAQRELDDTGDEEGAEQTDGLLTVLLAGRFVKTLWSGVGGEAHVTRLRHEEEEHDEP